MQQAPLGLWVALGGGIGATSRFLIGGWVTTWAYAGFPWATFAINVTGSMLLGYLLRTLASTSDTAHARAFLATGVCGGFTTFSTFDFETLTLLQQGSYGTAAVYSLGSVVSCVAGVYAGFRMASLRAASV